MENPEVWLRGPVPGIDPMLMPAAHALLQTLEDAERAVDGLTLDELWASPGGAASIGFHLRHIGGATDRLLTYARGERLDEAQKARLAEEKSLPRLDATTLLNDLRQMIERGMAQLRGTSRDALADARAVGRAGLPTTVLGLLFHAAEHAQRHAGQIVTTAKVVKAGG